MSRLRLRWNPAESGELALAGIGGESPVLVACALKIVPLPFSTDVEWSIGVEGVDELPPSMAIVGTLRTKCVAHGTVHGEGNGAEGSAQLARVLCERAVEVMSIAMDASVLIYGRGPHPEGKTMRELLEEHPDREPGEDLVAFAKRMGMGPPDDERKVH